MHNYDSSLLLADVVLVAGPSNKSDNDIAERTTKDTQPATTHKAAWNLE